MDKQLVKVTWLDANDPDAQSWFTDEEVDKFSENVCEAVSVGYLKSKTKLYVTLVGDYITSDDGSVVWGRPTKIPLNMITKMEALVLSDIMDP